MAMLGPCSTRSAAAPGLWFALLLASPATASAQAPSTSTPDELREQIEACFTPPAEAEASVRIALELAADGSLLAGPDVVAQEGSPAFTAAARRAILQCAPYRTSATGRIEVRFGSEDAPTTAEVPVINFSSDPLPGAPVPFSAPEGLCFVSPTRTRYEAWLWTVLQPPADRQEIVETLAVDCATLVRSLDVERPQPAEVAMVARTEEPPGYRETLAKFLARITAKIGPDGPPSPRFWESPPVEGEPYLMTDRQAAYSAARTLTADGRIGNASLYGYTRVAGETRTFILTRFDGSDIGPDSVERVVAWIRTAREEAGEPR